MKPAGGKIWFSAAELADLALPGLPRTKRKINEDHAAGWLLQVSTGGQPLARPRQARGGGMEFHLDVLPAAARTELAKRGVAIVAHMSDTPETRAQQLWRWYEGQNAKTKAEAIRRAGIVGQVDAFEAAGLTRSAAVASAAAHGKVGSSTLWAWLGLIDGVTPANRLPHLAPRRGGGGGAEAEIDPGAWQFMLSIYLRPEKPTWASCYRLLCEDYAPPRGLAVPHARTLWRKYEREVDPRLAVSLREGAEALRRMLPPQERTVRDLHALEAVNIDGHKFDVFVRFPPDAANPRGRIGRVVMVAIQDLYSRKFLAWRIGASESAILTRLAFGDLFRDWGIPKHCVLDNGRAFASKWITGGAKTRFRFKVLDDEPLGLLTQLGIQTHWTFPFRGQSKPIERGFRDLASDIAKHPAMTGAYTGNRPDAKPENYGDAAIPLAEFEAHVAREIVKHNARLGRRTEMAANSSFDIAFAESYAAAPIARATPEQLRLALLMAERVATDRKNGSIAIGGNRYWSYELQAFAGKKLTVRFDPEDLTADIHVYDREGGYIASAQLIEATGFFDLAAAKTSAKQFADLRRRVREAGRLQDLLDAGDIAGLLSNRLPEPPAAIETKVTRIVQSRGRTAAALKHVAQVAEPAPTPVLDRLARLRLVD